ncbi:MAG: AAA family ATPase, partial [Planctomycetota bacterium]
QLLTADDREQNAPVVLRRIAAEALPETSRRRIQRDASILQRVQQDRSPDEQTYVPLQGLIADRTHLAWVWPLIESPTLLHALATNPPDILASIKIVLSVLDALASLHRAGQVHADLRPSKIHLEENGQVRLVGSGPLVSTQVHLRHQTSQLDFATYASPELSGAVKHTIDPRSDLYSLGVILFQMLSANQQVPFQSDDLSDLLLQHTNRDPESLHTLPPTLPRILGDLVLRLLMKHPSDRYQTANAVADDLRRILGGLEKQGQAPDIAIGTTDLRNTLTTSSLVHRRDAYRKADEMMIDVGAGKRRFLEIMGCDGMGKSKLLDSLGRQARRRGFHVISTSSHAELRSETGNAIHRVVHTSLLELMDDRHLRDHMQLVMGPHRTYLMQNLPDIAKQFDWTHDNKESSEPRILINTRMQGSTEIAHDQFVEVMATLVRGLGTAGQPIAVLIDDAHDLDTQTIAVLQRVRNDENYQLLVAVAFDPLEAPDLHDRLKPHVQIELFPLPTQRLHAMARSMAGRLPDDVLESSRRLSNGSPFMIEAVLRGLVESDTMRPINSVAERWFHEGWEIDKERLADFQSSDDAADVLTRRLHALRRETREVLSLAAVIGKEFEVSQVLLLSDLPTTSALSGLRAARESNLIWVQPCGTRCVFFHDHIRVTLQDLQPEELQRQRHLDVAKHLI